VDPEAASDQDDRTGCAALEALGDVVPGDRRHSAGLVRQDDSKEVLAVSLLAPLALAHHERAGDLVPVGELAQQDASPLGRRAVPVLEECFGHPL
jgi:hypothetical protein